MSAMSASPPVGPPLMPLSLIAEHKVAPGVPKLPSKPQAPTANGMEAALPLVQPELPAPVLHNSTSPPEVAALPPQPQPPIEVAKRTEATAVTSTSTSGNNISGSIGGEVVKPGGAEAPGGEGVSEAAGAAPEEEAPLPDSEVEAAQETVPSVKPSTPVPSVTSTPQASAAPAASTPASSGEIKVATLPPQGRATKRKTNKVVNEDNNKKHEEEGEESGDGRKSKRVRLPTQPYQSPIPELNLIAKLDKPPAKPSDDKLIVFYRNEFLAVRNAEGGYYVCQAMQNIYKSSTRLRIRWLSQNEADLYIPDFYDTTEFDCILTNLNLDRVEKNKFRLPSEESQRTESILKRAIDAEKGVADNTTPTEEHPDGLDLSLYRNEEQLKKRKTKSKPKSPKKKKTTSTKSLRRSMPAKKSGGEDGSLGGGSSSEGGRKGTKKRGLLSRGVSKKRKPPLPVAKKPVVAAGKKQQQAPVSGGKRMSESSVNKKELGGKRKPVAPSAGPPPEKRPRRAPTNDSNSKTRSVVGVAGKSRRSARK